MTKRAGRRSAQTFRHSSFVIRHFLAYASVMSVFELRYQNGGVFLPKLGLWLDPHHRVSGPELAFVSHAHSDHAGSHRELIATAATARLMRARGAKAKREHILKFYEAHEFVTGGVPFRITLVPAGHVLGSAMAFLEA